MIPPWAALALMLITDLIPVAVFAARMAAHARAVRVAADRHYVFAFFGGLAGGLGMQGLTLTWLVDQMNSPAPVSYRLGMAALLANGFLGSAVAAGCVYLHLRMRTARDPDYEDAADQDHRPAPTDRDADGASPQ